MSGSGQWVVVLQTAIGIQLVFAALMKAGGGASLSPFLEAMAIPPVLVRISRVAVPLCEGALGTCLIAGTGWWAALGAAGLSLGFTAILVNATRMGVSESCRCFGALDSGVPTSVSAVRAAVLLTGSLVLLALSAGGPGTTSPITDATALPAALTGVLLGVACIACFALLGRTIQFERFRSTLRGSR
ncbi:MauE/DoxX family redox-associated membrane protein [Microtetraspora malaysiensis]|uniref:MauE/DoxX family redox-associated membrane protein n=1 Tax=Microtetraspora malaysiensis TaxID=161358 RepID=UPI003D8F3AB1